MRRSGKALSYFSRLLVLLFFNTLSLQQTRSTEQLKTCAPSSCGKISNISHPFRLRGDPPLCGDPRYELACEDNITALSLFSGKYYVQSINYNNYTVRIVDPGLKEDDCSSFPRYFLSQSNFSDTYDDSEYESRDGFREPYHARFLWRPTLLFEHIVYMNCSNQVRDDPEYVDTAPCLNWPSKTHIYAIPGDLLVRKLKAECHVKFAATMRWNWSLVRDNKTLSYSDIHRALLHGFEVSWLHKACQDRCRTTVYDYCYFSTESEKLECAVSYHGLIGNLY